MKSRRNLIRLGILLFLTPLFYWGYYLYSDAFYVAQFISKNDKISLENYSELLDRIESWPGSTRILSASDAKHLIGNDKVKKIEKLNDKIYVSLYYPEPDTEDNAEKRSAVISYNYPGVFDATDKMFVASVWTEGKIIGSGHLGSRIQFELIDSAGKIMMGPKIHLATSGLTYVLVRPTTSEPVPTGSFNTGFDVSKIVRINLRFILASYPEAISKFPASGKLVINNVNAISNLESVANFFGSVNRDRITSDKVNLAYEFSKIRRKFSDRDFFVGINYPWNNYGWDVGKNPYGLPENGGWSANENKLRDDLTYLKSAHIEPVRIYIFFDFRTGLEYVDGKLAGFDQYVRKDIESLLRISGEVGIKIIPVLFDFGIADGVGGRFGGEHPELIFTSEKYHFLVNMMMPLLKDMDGWNRKYGNPVYAIELMNEPDNMAALMIPGYYQSLRSWFQDLANIIHKETDFSITLGSHSIVDMQRWWGGIDIDIYQFHYYKYMQYEHDAIPQNLARKNIGMEGIIFAGEMQPYDVIANIDALKKNGYDGMLFWAFNTNDGFGLRGKKEMDEIIRYMNTEN